MALTQAPSLDSEGSSPCVRIEENKEMRKRGVVIFILSWWYHSGDAIYWVSRAYHTTCYKSFHQPRLLALHNITRWDFTGLQIQYPSTLIEMPFDFHHGSQFCPSHFPTIWNVQCWISWMSLVRVHKAPLIPPIPLHTTSSICFQVCVNCQAAAH